MSNKHLSDSPHAVRGTNKTWWYEESQGIEVIHVIHTMGCYVRTDHIKIPWRGLRLALARKDKQVD